MPFANVRGYRIHYQESGALSAPPIIFIHGLMNGMHVWDRLMKQLAGQYRVIALDLLGHGESEKPARPDLGIARQGRIVLSLLDHLNIDRANIVGHSMGGQTALWIGSHAPERVLRLAALTPFADRFLTPLTMFNCLMVAIGATVAPLGRTLTPLFRRQGPLRRTFVESVYCYRPQPEATILELYDEQFRPDNNPSKVAAIRGLLGYRALNDAHKLTAPMLIVGVEHDRVVPNAHAEKLAALRPDAQFTVIPGCGHMLQYDAPDEVYNTLSAFLAGQPMVRHTLNGHQAARQAVHAETIWTSGGGSD